MSSTAGRAAARLAAVWTLLLAVGYFAGRLVTDASWTWESSVVSAVRGSDGTPLTDLMRVITTLGSPLVLNVVFVVAVAGLLLAGQRRNALFLTLASTGSVLLEQILKHAVDRARPIGHHHTAAYGASWPSGHASSSLALYGALLLIGLSAQRRHNKLARPLALAAVAATTLLVALIGISRIYLGVHFPTDVAASWVLIGLWLTALYRTIRPHAPELGYLAACERRARTFDRCAPNDSIQPFDARRASGSSPRA